MDNFSRHPRPASYANAYTQPRLSELVHHFSRDMKLAGYSENTIQTKLSGAEWFVRWLSSGTLPMNSNTGLSQKG